MRIDLWHSPYNGGWMEFRKENLKTFRFGRYKNEYWWSVFGFCGKVLIQSWPWQKNPSRPLPEGVEQAIAEALAAEKKEKPAQAGES